MKEATIIGLISDTHGLLRPRACDYLRGSDYIVHNGTRAATIDASDHTFISGVTGPISFTNPKAQAVLPIKLFQTDPASASVKSLTDFVPVSSVAINPLLLVVHPSVPARNVKELIALAKARPGTLNYGGAGTGTNPHIAGELFNYLAKTEIAVVQYKGGGPALTAAPQGKAVIRPRQLLRVPLLICSLGGDRDFSARAKCACQPRFDAAPSPSQTDSPVAVMVMDKRSRPRGSDPKRSFVKE